MNELHLGVLPYGREYNGTFDYSDTDGIRLGSFQIPSILITPDENLLLQYPSLHGCVAYFINRSLSSFIL